MIEFLIQKHFDVANMPSGAAEISVKFVSIQSNEIRGFSGLNVVYINNDHFLNKFRFKKLDPSADVACMDIVSITINEYANVRLRQVCAELSLLT